MMQGVRAEVPQACGFADDADGSPLEVLSQNHGLFQVGTLTVLDAQSSGSRLNIPSVLVFAFARKEAPRIPPLQLSR